MRANQIDLIMRRVLIGSAITVSAVIFSIILFVGYQGLQTFKDVSFTEVFLSTDWTPSDGKYGILSFLISTFLLTFLSVLLAVPIAVSGAVFTAKIAPKWMRSIIRSATDLFVGIPSVVYGFIGLTVIIPMISSVTGATAFGILPAALILAVMVFPTILSISEDAIRALPDRLEEASYALGATRFQTIWRVQIPAAKQGIITGIILGMGRAIGETMAVFMVIGNAPKLPNSLTDSTSVLTTAIVKDLGNTTYGSTWNNSLFMMALVLLLVSLLFIVVIRIVSKRGEQL